jgi:hypothetical protein
MYNKMLKALLFFWGTVIVFYVVHIAIENKDKVKEFSTNIVKGIFEEGKNEVALKDTNSIPLQKEWGAEFSGIEHCYETHDFKTQDPALSSIGSSCFNGDCKMTVAFKDKVPEVISVKVREGDNGPCSTRKLKVKDPKVVGYKVEIVLTDEMREKLGIPAYVDIFSLKQATGYIAGLVNGIQKITFTYDSPVYEDDILVDDKKIGTIKFVSE